MSAVETIVAIATPPGRGGIGVVRLSGPAALACALPLLKGLPPALEANRVYFCHLQNPKTGEKLDEVLVTWFAAPRSYTGEDVIEISAHGAPVLLQHLVRLLVAQGARTAGPGAFTERAFLNGRLDLTQAEAVRDLVEAETLGQAQLAAQQLGGSVAHSIAPDKQRLIALVAMLEAGIDFAEDDTPVMETGSIARELEALHASLTGLEGSFAQGRLWTEGVSLAVVGRPNVGKSSLFNRLLGRDRAIVTAEAGTTRDTVQEGFQLGGIPIRLIDTAGLREATGEAERLGIVKSREALAEAGLVLLVLDASAETAGTLEGWFEEEVELAVAAAGRPLIVVRNKVDLVELSPGRREAGLPARVAAALGADAPVIATSAASGVGMDHLRESIATRLMGGHALTVGSAMLTNARQHADVCTAVEALAQAMQANAGGLPHEVMLLDLYTALRGLDALTGATTPDDVLHLVFATFCIGK